MFFRKIPIIVKTMMKTITIITIVMMIMMMIIMMRINHNRQKIQAYQITVIM